MRAFLTIPFTCLGIVALAAAPKATFTENKGQWPQQVLFRALIPGGALFVERSAFTYVLYSGGPLYDHGHAHEPGEVADEGKAHAYRVHFEGGRAQGSAGALKQPHYENYFLGHDPAQWGTGCGVFGEVLLKNVWPGIDLRLDGRNGIKYDLIVAPGADANLVRLRYEGQDGLELKDGSLHVGTSVSVVIEEAPIAFTQRLGNDATEAHGDLACRYQLNGDVLSFSFPNGRPHGEELIIDPALTFASYSGSTANNFGQTATYDDLGHLYGGGIVFSAGYPITTGVLQGFFSGGTTDVGISKWSPDGSSLVWSTYLGGSGNESPHSMVVNAANELYVMGSTGSVNFPVTPGALDASFDGGPSLIFNTGYGFNQTNGTDIYVAHFNADATALIGSTYVGGSANDGLNNSALLSHNYGDHFRGEIALDPIGNPVVATTTASNDMPVSAGAPQPAFGGGVQDGYCFRLNPSLSTLLWGTYLGGTGDDNGLGVQFDSNGEIFVSGGTTSANLPMVGTPFHATNSGAADGYVMRYGSAGTPLLSSTYLGTAAYDQTYFVQLNTADEVFVVGQTRGNYPVTPGKYVNAGSGQFVHKLTHNLTTSLWSTVLGNGFINQDLSPTAFLVSNCGQIYLSGWAGSTNFQVGNVSTTVGLPVTPDAFQPDTDGGDFYLMMLEPEGVALNYATFFGGNISSEHVDGGTSRFDKDGTVYQAVCAGCQGNSDFPTTPGAWSNTNNNSGCNLGVFKFNLDIPIADIGIDGPNVICFPSTVQFTNSSSGGDTYLWNFGDSGTSTEFEPAHLYTTEGVYTVSMIMTDSYGCSISDTADIQVISIPTPVATIAPVPPICPGSSVQLFASAGLSHAWFPPLGLNDTTISDPTATPPEPMTYWVVIESECGFDTTSVAIDWVDPVGSAGPDTSTCLGSGVALAGSGGGTYDWSPVATLSDPTIANPIASPVDSTVYSVIITTPEGCIVHDTVLVTVYYDPPEASLVDTVICAGSSLQLHAPDALYYAWQAASGITELDVQDPIVTPTAPTTYTVLISNACGSITDDVFVDLIFVTATAWPDTTVCPGQPVTLFALGGISYAWSPVQGLGDPDSSVTTAVAPANTTYSVLVTDINGCQNTAEVVIDLFPYPTVNAGRDVLVDWHDEVQLNATGDGILTWAPPEGLDRIDGPSPIASPEESTTYTVTITDEHGCRATDEVMVILNGSLYVPNSFTPDGDGYNDGFGAWGKDIQEIELLVFNRWGELIWSTTKLNDRWDGTYKGVASPIDTYVWKVDATEVSGRKRNAIGHVTLVR